MRIKKTRLYRHLEGRLAVLERKEARAGRESEQVRAKLKRLTAALLRQAGAVDGTLCRVVTDRGVCHIGTISQVAGPDCIDVHVPALQGYIYVRPRNLTLLKGTTR